MTNDLNNLRPDQPREQDNTTSTPRIKNTRNFHTCFMPLWKRDPKSDKITRLDVRKHGNIKCKEGERRHHESGQTCKSDLPLVAAFPIRSLQSLSIRR
ncbi:hypothetical protein GE21DRAFT_1312313 [Neurospora crassa]|nr:hypothetical protein GE21DRAFT_1312313 [Neurospora crassa]